LKAVSFPNLLHYRGEALSYQAIVCKFAQSMKGYKILILFFLMLASRFAFGQVNDSVPLIFADSLKTVYIYADTGKALNRIDAQGRKQGLWEKRYPNGKVRYRGRFLNDNPKGVFKYYWDNDSVQNITVYSEDGKIARTKMFQENGGLLSIGKFVDRKRDSVWVYYNPFYKLSGKEQYKLGKKEGKFITFYQNGNALEVKNWHNGLENGLWQQFFDDGQLKLEGNYVNGKMQGAFKAYDPGNTDTPIIIGNYFNDLKEGQWIFFRKEKNTTDTVMYHKDMPVKTNKFQYTPQQLDSLRQQNQEFQQRFENPRRGGDDSDPGKD
jgi:antitoxin component YwqK of YwqJK toxin-antitoxin module